MNNESTAELAAPWTFFYFVKSDTSKFVTKALELTMKCCPYQSIEDIDTGKEFWK